MMRIVCDTNVLVSAILFGGHPRNILEQIIEGKLIGVISPELRRELADVLSRPKFGLSTPQVESIMRLIAETFVEVFPKDVPDLIKTDPDDNIVLACAAEANAETIVSGDGHLLSLDRYEDIVIQSPSQFLDQRTQEPNG